MSQIKKLLGRAGCDVGRAVLAAAIAFAVASPASAQTPLAPAAAPAATPAPTPAPSAGPPVPVELNKLEPVAQPSAGCRVYFLVTNPDAEPFEQLRLDLILFATDGVIARRVAFDLGPLAAKKQAVRLFDLPGLGCDDIGKVLINDVISCVRHSGAPAADGPACLDRLALTSRTKATLNK